MLRKIKILPTFKGAIPGFYSFIGPVAYYSLREHDYGCHYYCDGILSASIFGWSLGRYINRTSFDYGSVAKPFFEECVGRNLKVLIVGGKPAEAEAFGKHLSIMFPSLNKECIDGYPPGGFKAASVDSLWLLILSSKIDVLILAMGSPLQECIGKAVMARGFQGTVITAGAFITQTVLSGHRGTFYPRWINTLNLRFLWRLIYEPHTRSRFKYVLSFPFSYMIDSLRGRIKVICSEYDTIKHHNDH